MCDSTAAAVSRDGVLQPPSAFSHPAAATWRWAAYGRTQQRHALAPCAVPGPVVAG